MARVWAKVPDSFKCTRALLLSLRFFDAANHEVCILSSNLPELREQSPHLLLSGLLPQSHANRPGQGRAFQAKFPQVRCSLQGPDSGRTRKLSRWPSQGSRRTEKTHPKSGHTTSYRPGEVRGVPGRERDPCGQGERDENLQQVSRPQGPQNRQDEEASPCRMGPQETSFESVS